MTDAKRPVELQVVAATTTTTATRRPIRNNTKEDLKNCASNKREDSLNQADKTILSPLEPFLKAAAIAVRPPTLTAPPIRSPLTPTSRATTSSSLLLSSENKDFDLPSQILPHLYVGGQTQTQIDTLSNLNISYILSLQSNLPKFLSNLPQSTLSLPLVNSSKDYLVKAHKLIRGKCINISDTFDQSLDKFFDETYNFIEEARKNKCNVLVHCNAGISRSPTIAIAYLMKWKRMRLQEAYNFVKRCRPQISPNLNFMGQLVSYERKLMACEYLATSPIPPLPTCHDLSLARFLPLTETHCYCNSPDR